MRLLKISSEMSKMTTDQLVEMARLNPQLDIRRVVNFAKSSLSPSRQADLAYAMSLVRGLPEDMDTRMFIYDVLIREPSTPPLRSALRTAIDAPRGFGVIESEKLWLAAAADPRNAAVAFMARNTPPGVTEKIADRYRVNQTKSSLDIASRDNLLAKMKDMQGEGFEWGSNYSGNMIAKEIEHNQSVEKFVFGNLISFPDFLAGVVLGDEGKNSFFGSWRRNPEYRALMMEAKRDNIKTASMLFFYATVVKDNPEAVEDAATSFFGDGDISFDEKEKAYDNAIPNMPESICAPIRKAFSSLPDERAYNHVLKDFLAGKADDMVGILTSSMDKALSHGEEIYGRIKLNPQLRDGANPTFLAIFEALEGKGRTEEEPFDEGFTSTSWFDKARIMHEAGMLDSISKETKKNLLIGYLLFIAGLPLWVWAAKSGTSEREMLSHPEMKQKAESIYGSSNDQMRIELDRLKGQIQREVEERQRKALDAPPKQTPSPKAAAFKECEVTPELVQTIISLEHDPRKQTSSAGAAGKMQIMKPTWDELNRKHFSGRYPWHKYRFNQQVNIMFGTQYLKDIKAFLDGNRDEWKADQHSLIMACYFGGIGNVENARFDPSIMKRKLPLTYDYMLRGTNLMERDAESLLVFQKKGTTSIVPIAPFSYTRLEPI